MIVLTINGFAVKLSNPKKSKKAGNFQPEDKVVAYLNDDQWMVPDDAAEKSLVDDVMLNEIKKAPYCFTYFGDMFFYRLDQAIADLQSTRVIDEMNQVHGFNHLYRHGYGIQHMLAIINQPEIVDLLTNEMDINLLSAQGQTPLIFAANNHHIHAVAGYLFAGADQSAKNSDGLTWSEILSQDEINVVSSDLRSLISKSVSSDDSLNSHVSNTQKRRISI